MSIYPSAYVYKVTHNETGEFYIGSCTNKNAREMHNPKEHFLIHYFTSGPWRNELKFNPEKFTSTIMFTSNEVIINPASNKEEFVAYWYEQYLIYEQIKLIKNPLCINIHCINPNNLLREFGTQGKIVSNETRDKIKLSNTGKKQSPEFVEKRIAPLRGRTYKNPKMSQIKTGKKRKPFTEDAKLNMSFAQIGKIKTKETTDNLSKKRKGTISVFDTTILKFVHITTIEYHLHKDRYFTSSSRYVKNLKMIGVI